MISPAQTYSSTHLRRQREAHLRADGYGRHRHVYLHGTIRRLARDMSAKSTEPGLTWLDYGCGKGTFIEQIRPFGLFSRIAGFDPAVDEFRAPAEGRYDLVTCLDVLDIAEPRFLPAILSAVAGSTGIAALFDCLTRPRPGSSLRPHPPFYWTHLVGQAMTVMDTLVEFPGLDGFERVLIVAAPPDSPIRFRFSSM